MGFDYLLFKDGLEVAGIVKKNSRGIQWYDMERYSDLDYLLGDNWHFQGINDRGDYGYVILDSVEYYLSQRRSITEYLPSTQSSDQTTAHTINTGHSLKFTFVQGYGNKSTFGKDSSIFK